MAIIGSAYVEIHAIDKHLQREIDNAVKKIKDPTINFQSDIDLKPVRAKIKALRAELKAAPLQLKIDANYEEVLDNIDAIRHQQENDDVQINFAPQTEILETALESIQERYSEVESTVNANANTAAAEAQMAFVSRNRRANIDVHIDPKTKKAFEGLLYTLVGAVPADKVKAALQGVAGNFEALAVKASVASAAIGALGASALTLGANLFGIAGDLIQVGGLITLMPAGIFALTTVLKVNKMAWQDFGDAAKDNSKKANEALAKLPPEAQKAAVAMRGVKDEIQKPVQKAFWESVGTSLQDMVSKQLPTVITGMTKIGSTWGLFTKEVFDSVAGLRGFDKVFANVDAGVRNMTKGLQPAIEGLARFIGTGSRFLPEFGTYIAGLADKFGNFAKKAQESGQMMEWVRTGTRRLQELGTVITSTAGIFNGFVTASRMSGASGLTDFANGMERIRDIVQGEPFQSRLINVLEGARAGTDALGDGFKELTTFVGNSSRAIGIFLETSGRIGGTAFSSIKTMFDGTGLGSGLMTALWGLEDALEILQPGFQDLGEIFGDLGEIAGTTLTSMAPGLNNLLSTLAGIINGLKDGVIATMPIFNAFLQNILQLAAGPLITIAEGVGNILKAFAGMPGPLQVVIMSFGLLLAFRGKFAALFGGIASSFATMRQGMDGNIQGLNKSMTNMYRHFGNARTSLGSVGNALSLIPFAAATGGLGGVRDAAAGATRSMGAAAGAGLRGALSGASSLLGGPWGVAVAGGIALISAFGQAQADSDAKVKALSGTLEQQTGKITNATKTMLATNALDGATNGWDNFVRGVLQGSASVEETLGDIGMSTKEFTDRLADPSGRDSFTRGLDEITMALKLGKPVTDEMAAAVGLTKEELKGVTGQSFAHLATKARDAAGELTKAEANVRAIAEATGTNSVQAATLARNYETLASATTSASDKFSALKQNLDILNGGAMTAADAQQNVAQSFLNTGDAFARIKEQAGGAVQSLYNVKTGFNFATQAGIDLRTAVSGSADTILQLGTAALDQALKAGKGAADANSIAVQAMQPAIAGLRNQLSGLGLAQPQIDSIIRSFGLMPDQVSTALSVTGRVEAEREIALLKLASDSFANGNYTAVLAALPGDAKAKIEEATGLGNAFKNGDYTAIMDALNRADGGAAAALASILAVTDGNYEAAIKALDLTLAPATAATANINAVPDHLSTINAIDHATAVAGQAGRSINATPNALRTIRAIDHATEVARQASASINGTPNVTRSINAIDRATEIARVAKNSLNGTPNVTRSINAIDYATAKARAASGSINSVTGKTVPINVTTNAQGVAYSAQVAINSVQGKIVDIVTRHTTLGNPGTGGRGIVNAVANGGIFNTLGKLAFANGGMFNGIKSFANGSERHVAQIARGAWPARMWAEPETGGEAYIPLSISKRFRSLKILEQVAEMFGYTLFKKFADGGLMPKMASMPVYTPTATAISPTSTSTSGSVAPVFYVNVYSTEADSKAVAAEVIKELNWQIRTV